MRREDHRVLIDGGLPDVHLVAHLPETVVEHSCETDLAVAVGVGVGLAEEAEVDDCLELVQPGPNQFRIIAVDCGDQLDLFEELGIPQLVLGRFRQPGTGHLPQPETTEAPPERQVGRVGEVLAVGRDRRVLERCVRVEKHAVALAHDALLVVDRDVDEQLWWPVARADSEVCHGAVSVGWVLGQRVVEQELGGAERVFVER